MAKKYYAWKNANCNGHNPEWIEMNGAEFISFIRKPENKKRYFIEFFPDDPNEDGVLIETTKSKYDEWHKENMRYLRKKETYDDAYTVLSLDCEQSSGFTLYDEIPSEENVEQIVLGDNQIERLLQAISFLNEEEIMLINTMYSSSKNLSEREGAEKLKIPKSTINRMKNKIFKKIKKIMGQN